MRRNSSDVSWRNGNPEWHPLFVEHCSCHPTALTDRVPWDMQFMRHAPSSHACSVTMDRTNKQIPWRSLRTRMHFKGTNALMTGKWERVETLGRPYLGSTLELLLC